MEQQRSIIDYLSFHAERSGDKTAILYEDQALNYRELRAAQRPMSWCAPRFRHRKRRPRGDGHVRRARIGSRLFSASSASAQLPSRAARC